MIHRRLSIRCAGAELPAVLSLPTGSARAGVVPLHPSNDRSRSQFLFEHLAQVLPARGVAVLRYFAANDLVELEQTVLAFYGDDEWVPVQESIGVWRRRFPDAASLTIRELPGTTHFPTLGGGRDLLSLSPEYTATLTGWLEGVLAIPF